jgi:hypothetical protein
MTKESKPEIAAAKLQAFPTERDSFKFLLLSNPNYFGNLEGSAYKEALKINFNTFYEELACLGYHPQQRQLEGVIYVYQPSGYSGDICEPGSQEFVRFYLSYDGGITWQDVGLTSVQVHDIPEGTKGPAKLEYAVSLPVNPKRKFCTASPLIRARAILSWNNPPPANAPGWIPIWGNVRESVIIVEPWKFIILKDLLVDAKLKLPPEFAEVLDPEAVVNAKPAKLGAVELAKMYRGTDVPVHRFAHTELMAFSQSASILSAEGYLPNLADIQINPGIFEQLFPVDGNTSFEELKCIGLDPNLPDTLVGVIQLKKPTGFSGGPCTNGSKEYVTFWGDFDHNGTFETCLGTADVTVYDVAVPPAGVHVAVRLPVDLNQYRQPCAEGPVVVPIRAILSWNVPAPCPNPGYVPTWGNREETLIHIAPKVVGPAGHIAILGGVPVSMIDNITGLTTPAAVWATNNLAIDSFGRECAFARRVTVQGSPIPGYSYVVEVSPDNMVWTPVLTDLAVTDSIGNVSTHSANPITLRFDYLNFTQNVNAVLAQWDTAGDALWHVRLRVYNGGGILQSTDQHRIQLDNTAPEASIEITTGAGDCGKFGSGAVIGGNFVATDLRMHSWSLSVEPAINDPGEAIPSPSSGLVNTAVAPGDAWTLDTTGMDPCGYIIRVVAADRAIVNSQSLGLWASDSAGFCIEG